MHTTPPVSAARANASTPLQTTLLSAPLADCLSADFKKRTLTFKLPDNHAAQPGAYYLVPAIVGQLAVAQEAAVAAQTITFPATGKLHSSHQEAGNDLVLYIFDDLGNAQDFYRHRPAADDRYSQGDVWRGHAQRTDCEGIKWRSSMGSFVTDNFGELVRVSA